MKQQIIINNATEFVDLCKYYESILYSIKTMEEEIKDFKFSDDYSFHIHSKRFKGVVSIKNMIEKVFSDSLDLKNVNFKRDFFYDVNPDNKLATEL